MSVTAKALWYVESHLDTELSLDGISEAAGVSRFHLSRAFATSTGLPLAGYGRARRLSVAATALIAGAPDILTVALNTGYGSHEAFTRAFRQHFGLTPEQLRSQANTQNITLQEPIKMNNPTIVTLAKPRLVKGDAMLIFGLSQRCPAAGDPGIAAQWNRFLPYFGHIEGQIGNVAYGVIYNSGESCEYDYMCGVAVRDFPARPPEFSRLQIPVQTYAVFDHREHVSAVGAAWKAIWEYGLADAGLRPLEAPAIERYPETFDGRTGLGGLELWVPVKG